MSFLICKNSLSPKNLQEGSMKKINIFSLHYLQLLNSRNKLFSLSPIYGSKIWEITFSWRNTYVFPLRFLRQQHDVFVNDPNCCRVSDVFWRPYSRPLFPWNSSCPTAPSLTCSSTAGEIGSAYHFRNKNFRFWPSENSFKSRLCRFT